MYRTEDVWEYVKRTNPNITKERLIEELEVYEPTTKSLLHEIVLGESR